MNNRIVARAADGGKQAFSAVRLSPAEFVREMRVTPALKWHEAGAAAVAGVSREALLMAAGKFRVSAALASSRGTGP